MNTGKSELFSLQQKTETHTWRQAYTQIYFHSFCFQYGDWRPSFYLGNFLYLLKSALCSSSEIFYLYVQNVCIYKCIHKCVHLIIYTYLYTHK